MICLEPLCFFLPFSWKTVLFLLWQKKAKYAQYYCFWKHVGKATMELSHSRTECSSQRTNIYRITFYHFWGLLDLWYIFPVFLSSSAIKRMSPFSWAHFHFASNLSFHCRAVKKCQYGTSKSRQLDIQYFLFCQNFQMKDVCNM